MASPGRIAAVLGVVTPWEHATPVADRTSPAEGYPTSAMDESDDILDRFHGLGREFLGARSAVGEHRIDISRVLLEAPHLGIDRRKLGHEEFHQGILEGGELCAAMLLEHIGFARI